MEYEKINVPSSENDSTLLSVEKGNDSAATELISPKETFPSSESSLAKIYDPVEKSNEKESLINSQTDNIMNLHYPKSRQTNWNMRKSMYHL